MLIDLPTTNEGGGEGGEGTRFTIWFFLLMDIDVQLVVIVVAKHVI